MFDLMMSVYPLANDCFRYCNMDFIFTSALTNQPPSPGQPKHLHPGQQQQYLPLVVSYDIMCQWVRHLSERIAELPAHIQIELPDSNVRYAIPKYHLNGHKEDNHNQFSLNFMRGVGRTDGEEVERGWSRFDGTAASTREMGPGSREETLEDHFEFNNMDKYFGLGM